MFITHFHADHWLGLPGMLKSFALRERTQPLTRVRAARADGLMEQMRFVYGRLPYELSVVELEPAETVQRDGYLIAAIPVSHKGEACYGYALVEEPRPGHLDPELAERLGVRPGPDFGRLQRGETVGGVTPEQVMGAVRQGRKIVHLRGHRSVRGAVVAAHESDVLVHEATFAEEEAERARQTSHSTARQAAEVAREAEVRLLALTHISSRYPGGELRDEARAVFAADRGAARLRHDRGAVSRARRPRAGALVRAPGARGPPAEPVARGDESLRARSVASATDTFRGDPLTRSREARKEPTWTAAARRSSSARTTCGER